MISKEEKAKIKEIIEKEVKEKKLDNSKIKEIEKILEFLIDKDQNISSILGTTGAGKTISIDIAIDIFQNNKKCKRILKNNEEYKNHLKNNKIKNKIVKRKINLWKLFGLKNKEDYCKNCLPSVGKKWINNSENNENLHFNSYAPHECNTNENNKLIVTSLYIKKMLWTSIINKICYEKLKSKKLLKTIKYEKIDVNKKNENFKLIFQIFLIFSIFIIAMIILTFKFQLNYIYSSIISVTGSAFLLLLKKIINNSREININQILVDQSTNEILSETINQALKTRKKYLKIYKKNEIIILHFENIDRLWDWLKISESPNKKNESFNNKPPRSKIIIEILENIGLLYKSENINLK